MRRPGDPTERPAEGSFAQETRDETQAVQRSRPFTLLVRAGFLARGITYAVLGLLALALASGAGTIGAKPSQQGALALIARDWLGRAALVVISAGLLAYALWKLSQAILGRGPEGGGGPALKDRVANFGGAIAYGGFFAVAMRALGGSGGGSSSEPRQAAAGVLGWPGGRVLVAAAGALLLAISAYQLYDATSGNFAKDSKTEQMKPDERRLFMLLGHVGLAARALVFALVGYFVLRTATDFNPGKAVGVDGALARLHQQTLGPWLVGTVAAGLLIFAAYSLLEARHRRL